MEGLRYIRFKERIWVKSGICKFVFQTPLNSSISTWDLFMDFIFVKNSNNLDFII